MVVSMSVSLPGERVSIPMVVSVSGRSACLVLPLPGLSLLAPFLLLLMTWPVDRSLQMLSFWEALRVRHPLQCSCLEHPRDGGAWWVAVYGVAQSQTQLKRLSSSSSRVKTKFTR